MLSFLLYHLTKAILLLSPSYNEKTKKPGFGKIKSLLYGYPSQSLESKFELKEAGVPSFVLLTTLLHQHMK